MPWGLIEQRLQNSSQLSMNPNPFSLESVEKSINYNMEGIELSNLFYSAHISKPKFRVWRTKNVKPRSR